MAQRQSDYERLYNVGILDDIHNYFPDLLYNSGQFQTVQDVLTYVQQNTRERFDLYSSGLRHYQQQRVQTPPRRSRQEEAQAPPPAPRVRIRTAPRIAQAEEAVAAAAAAAAAAQRPVRRQPVVSVPVVPSIVYNTEEDDPELMQQLDAMMNFMASEPTRPSRVSNMATIFSSLFGNLAGPLPAQTPFDGLTAQARTRFMEPVVVRPTAEQIERGSRMDTLAVASADNCAICQDSFAAHSNRRTLTHCGHAFHLNCIDTWFEQNVHCPVCRHDVRDLAVD